MTSKYKFRGKSLKTGEWVYGSLLEINDNSYIYPYKTGDLDDIDFGCGFVKVSKESVGQFTGLKDKNTVFIQIRNKLLLYLGFTLVNKHGHTVHLIKGQQVMSNPKRVKPYSLDDPSWRIHKG